MFTVESSFVAHTSRKHSACSVDSISDMYREPIFQSSDVDACEDAPQCSNDETTNESIDLPENFNESFLRKVSLFYLKSQGRAPSPSFNNTGDC